MVTFRAATSEGGDVSQSDVTLHRLDRPVRVGRVILDRSRGEHEPDRFEEADEPTTR